MPRGPGDRRGRGGTGQGGGPPPCTPGGGEPTCREAGHRSPLAAPKGPKHTCGALIGGRGHVRAPSNGTSVGGAPKSARVTRAWRLWSGCGRSGSGGVGLGWVLWGSVTGCIQGPIHPPTTGVRDAGAASPLSGPPTWGQDLTSPCPGGPSPPLPPLGPGPIRRWVSPGDRPVLGSQGAGRWALRRVTAAFLVGRTLGPAEKPW